MSIHRSSFGIVSNGAAFEIRNLLIKIGDLSLFVAARFIVLGPLYKPDERDKSRSYEQGALLTPVVKSL